MWLPQGLSGYLSCNSLLSSSTGVVNPATAVLKVLHFYVPFKRQIYVSIKKEHAFTVHFPKFQKVTHRTDILETQGDKEMAVSCQVF